MGLLNELNLTVGMLIIMVLSMVIVEGGRIVKRVQLGRKVNAKSEFSWSVWVRDWTNWATLILSLLTSVVLLSIREGVVEFGGLTIAKPDRFELFFAAVVGSGGQGLWKIVLGVLDAWLAKAEQPASR